MIQIDLITGFLGAGKTSFIRRYARHFIDKGLNIGILENDFGAVNVDAMLLQDILGDNCDLEMVAGGCDEDCHRRRFKTKLIAMGMCGYDRVLVEPSGIFDMDEFFDVLHEDPLDRFYEIGNVITVIDASLEHNLSPASRYILASQAAQAGSIIYSHMENVTDEQLAETKDYVRQCLEDLHCKNLPEILSKQTILQKPLDQLDEHDFQAIMSSGYQVSTYEKLWFDDRETYDSLYFMNMDFTKEFLEQTCHRMINDPACGNIFRIKGFLKLADDTWISINVTHEREEFLPVPSGQAILIVIGEGLKKKAVEAYWGKSNDPV